MDWTTRGDAGRHARLVGGIGILAAALLTGACGGPRPAPPPAPPAPPAAATPVPGATMLPADARIVPPAPGLPAGRAGLSGRWAGDWDDHSGSHVLIVEEVGSQGALVLLTLPRGGLTPWLRTRARFEDDVLICETPRGIFRYAMQPDGSVLAVTERDGQSHRARLVRQPWNP